MARIPIVPIETGPVIGPALETANRIREGRARASITEEMARTYPQERKARLSILEEGAKRAPLETEAKRQDIDIRGKQEGRAVAKEGRDVEDQKLQQIGKLFALSEAVIPKATNAGEYNRSLEWLKAQGADDAFLGEKLPEDMSDEDVRRHIETVVKPELGRAREKFKLEEESIRARIRGQDVQVKVAEIYANREKRDYSGLTGSDKRLIDRNLRQDYDDEFMEWVVDEKTDQQVHRKKPGAPGYNKAWRDKRYKENVAKYEAEGGPKPQLEY